MVTKGLDFENVTLVGVVSADTMLHIDDFRSGERTFGILEQVAGRAGRGEKHGRAVIQTYSPEHEAVMCAVDHDYNKFYNDEIKMRELFMVSAILRHDMCRIFGRTFIFCVRLRKRVC